MLFPRGAKLYLYVTEAHSSIALAKMDDRGAIVFSHTIPLRDRLNFSSGYSNEAISQGVGSSADSTEDSRSAGRSSKTMIVITGVSAPISLTPKPRSSENRASSGVQMGSQLATVSGGALAIRPEGDDKSRRKRFSWGWLKSVRPGR